MPMGSGLIEKSFSLPFEKDYIFFVCKIIYFFSNCFVIKTIFLLKRRMKMKKITYLILALLICVSLVGCGNKTVEENEETEIVVFAAASMTETLEEIKGIYEKDHPEIKITYTFDSSGSLKTQIEEGAECDIFISAAQKQMDALYPNSENYEGENLIDSDSRIDFLENKIVLVVPEGNPKNVQDFSDIEKDELELIALGNEDVPVGQYSEELFRNLGIWDEIQGKISFGSNVKEVTTWVDESVVDCGIVYATDAYSAGLEIVAEAGQDLVKTPVIYPLAIMGKSEVKDEAGSFIEYLIGPEAGKVFEAVGFALIKGE